VRISGLLKSSLIDYPGKVSAVVFTQGCNFRCGFCHNPSLVPITNNQSLVTNYQTDQEILEFFELRKGKLDGVVITGGEPTLQSDLYEFTKKIKALGYSVKLDTNGSNAEMLSNLLANKLINYVAMDIKNVPAKYKKTCSYPFSDEIKKSIELIMVSGVDYEFRTTVLSHYHQISDFEKIGEIIKGAKRYVIQGFRGENVLDKSLMGTKKFTKDELGDIKKVFEKYVEMVEIRDNL